MSAQTAPNDRVRQLAGGRPWLALSPRCRRSQGENQAGYDDSHAKSPPIMQPSHGTIAGLKGSRIEPDGEEYCFN